jgi:hypothetical protein
MLRLTGDLSTAASTFAQDLLGLPLTGDFFTGGRDGGSAIVEAVRLIAGMSLPRSKPCPLALDGSSTSAFCSAAPVPRRRGELLLNGDAVVRFLLGACSVSPLVVLFSNVDNSGSSSSDAPTSTSVGFCLANRAITTWFSIQSIIKSLKGYVVIPSLFSEAAEASAAVGSCLQQEARDHRFWVVAECGRECKHESWRQPLNVLAQIHQTDISPLLPRMQEDDNVDTSLTRAWLCLGG